MRNASTVKKTFGLKDGESKAMDTKLSRPDVAMDEDFDDEGLSKKSFDFLKDLFQENNKVELKALAKAIEDSGVEDFTESFWDGNIKVMGEDEHGAVTRILGFKNVVDGDFMIFFESQGVGNVLRFEGRNFGYDDIDRIAGLLGVQESFRDLYQEFSSKRVEESPSGRSSHTESVKLTEYHGKDHKALITLLKITEAFQGNSRYVDDGVELSVSHVADYVFSGGDDCLWKSNLKLAFKKVTEEGIENYSNNEDFYRKLISAGITKGLGSRGVEA